MTPGWLSSHAGTRAAEWGAWALVVAGVLLAVVPARVPEMEVRVPSPASGAVAAPVRTVNGASWLAENPFAASRRAPERRWRATDTATAEAERGGIAAPVSDVPRLFGTLVAPAGSSALLRLEAAWSRARLYMEGERGGAYIVRRILNDRVILDGPSGRIELRLRRGEARP